MSQPPVSGPGQGEQPGPDLGLANFTQDGPGDACLPGPGLAAVLDRLSGPDQRCPGADDDQLIGLLGRWQALESWAAAGKLGVVRELLRRRADRPGRDLAPGDLPQSWDRGTGHEIAAALSLSLPAADKLADFSWALRARLPGIGVALAQGIIDNTKATIIVRELAVLDDEHAAAAEALIVGELAGKTAAQIGRLAAAAVCAVDPQGSEKRREYAEREDARVRLWRDNSGTSALAGYALPTDAALAAHAAISQRAQEYKKANVSPDAKMDQLRVLAFATSSTASPSMPASPRPAPPKPTTVLRPGPMARRHLPRGPMTRAPATTLPTTTRATTTRRAVPIRPRTARVPTTPALPATTAQDRSAPTPRLAQAIPGANPAQAVPVIPGQRCLPWRT